MQPESWLKRISPQSECSSKNQIAPEATDFRGDLILSAPLVEPAEIFSVPEKRILRLEYPVVLIREYKQS